MGRAFMASPSVGYVLLDERGRVRECNPTFARALGTTPPELFDCILTTVSSAPWVQEVVRRARAAARSGEPSGEFTLGPAYTSLQGRPQYAVCIPTGQGREVGVLAWGLTAQQELTRALSEIDQVNRLVANAIPAKLALREPGGRVLFLNQRWRDYLGAAGDELLDPYDHSHPDDRAAIEAAWRQALASPREIELRFRVRRADDQYRWNTSTVVPVYSPTNELLGWAGVSVEVHDLLEARMAAEESELRLRTTLEALPAVVYATDSAGRVTFCNQHFLDYTGVSPEQARAWAYHDLVHPDDIATTAAEWERARRTGTPAVSELRLRKHDGSYEWHLGRAIPVPGANGDVAMWIGAHINIHDRRMAEEALALSERRHRALAEALPQIIWTARPDGTNDYVNTRAREYTGTAEGDGAWQQHIHPDDAGPSQARWDESLRSGEPYEVEHRIRAADGSYRWFLTRALAIRDTSGAIASWFGTSTDIHAQKEAASALEAANLLKDEFLALVSHEMRTPLTYILGNVHALRRLGRTVPPETLETILSDMEAGSERMLELVENILVLVRITSPADVVTEPVLVDRVVARTVAQHRRDYPDRPIELELGSGDAPARASPQHLQRILANLLSNAERYTPAAKPVRVRTALEGRHIRLTVVDSGTGVSDEDLAHLTEPFYRSERIASPGSGAGLGLAACRRLVEAQGGTIRLANVPGGGLEVSFTLPLAD